LVSAVKEDTMDIVKTAQKGKTLDVMERLCIYKTSKNKSLMNEQFVTDSNALFELAVKTDIDGK
jgi:hypothetical protein